MKISRVGVDLAKSVFQLHGTDAHGKAVWKRKLSRGKWVEALCMTAPIGSEIGMEACASAHHWARLLTQHGYQVKLIPRYRQVNRSGRSISAGDNQATALPHSANALVLRFR